MAANLIKRKKRYPFNTLMLYSDVKCTLEFEHAKLFNFNRDGLLFETNEKLIPGSEIFIEIANYMSGHYYSQDGSDTYIAKVKWCNPAEDSEGYAVGAEITGSYNKN